MLFVVCMFPRKKKVRRRNNIVVSSKQKCLVIHRYFWLRPNFPSSDKLKAALFSSKTILSSREANGKTLPLIFCFPIKHKNTKDRKEIYILALVQTAKIKNSKNSHFPRIVVNVIPNLFINISRLLTGSVRVDFINLVILYGRAIFCNTRYNIKQTCQN